VKPRCTGSIKTGPTIGMRSLAASASGVKPSATMTSTGRATSSAASYGYAYPPASSPSPCSAVMPGPFRGAARGAAGGALIGAVSGNAGRGAAIGAGSPASLARCVMVPHAAPALVTDRGDDNEENPRAFSARVLSCRMRTSAGSAARGGSPADTGCAPTGDPSAGRTPVGGADRSRAVGCGPRALRRPPRRQ
jgi:hypothetical protein